MEELEQGFEDSDKWIERARKWLEFFEFLRDGEWKKAKACLRELPRGEDRGWWQWCNQATKIISALEQMASSKSVRDPLVPWQEKECPYRKLQLSAETPVEKVKEYYYELQSRGMSDFERISYRVAYDVLRLVEKRLLADFALYQIRSPERAGAVLDVVQKVGEGFDPRHAVEQLGTMSSDRNSGGGSSRPMRRAVAAALGDDAGIFHALLREHDVAVVEFLELARNVPEDPTNLLHLGLAAAARCNKEAGGEEDLTDVWNYVVIGLAAAMADDRFWHRWWAARRNIYTVTSQQIHEAQIQTQRFWVNHLKSIEEQYQNLGYEFQAELNGAKAANDGRGIPLDPNCEKRAVVGILGTRVLGLTPRVSEWVASVKPEAVQQDGWERQSCLYFSELRHAAALFEDGRYDDCLGELEALDDLFSASLAETNPAFAAMNDGAQRREDMRADLTAQAHERLGMSCLERFPVEVAGAMKHWSSAVAATRGKDQIRDLQARIRKLTIGRVNSLQEKTEVAERLEALNDSLSLLAQTIDEGWDEADQSLQQVFVDALPQSGRFPLQQL